MTHKQIVEEVEKLGMIVWRVPASDRKSFIANSKKLRVYWSTSFEGGLLSGGRLIFNGVDTHFTSPATIAYYGKL